ncbi:histidine kinase [Chitinophagaceae bacterium LB-8]|uniref:Histidine kinase n=1 Tax=Paraflavisolibacter caeni TaxID=2982496 RepID=A0A9X3B7R3_9BACT|nr:two-component regulator propeller domain-containing protein [Paraflavisolibacter caeni]MCU7548751.1 histidine kinase [Paraflavisolibacter caeni]
MALVLILLAIRPAWSQEIFFSPVLPPEGKVFRHVTGIVQDKEGYMWFASKKGLFRYDGYEMTTYTNNPFNKNSLASDALEAICVDSSGILWIAIFGKGLDRFDPVTGIFKHYHHDPKDPGSISGEWVNALYVDHEGTLWVGTGDGLDRLDPKTGKFIHYRNQPGDPVSISNNEVVAIYEDRQCVLWIGTGSVYSGKDSEGGLNRMDKKTGKFSRYFHDPKNPHSLVNNKVRAIYEDRKGNFWVGTSGDGLHTMNRQNGSFQRYPYDPEHPEKLSRPPFKKKPFLDFITFITEDITGGIWIGTSESGLNYYNPLTGKTRHYEHEKDTAGAFTDGNTWWTYTSKEGVLWISTLYGNLYRVNPLRRDIPFYESFTGSVNAFYEAPDGSFWTGTERGLVIKNYKGKGETKMFVHEPGNPYSLSNSSVLSITPDSYGKIWVGTFEGLNVWDEHKNGFIHYRHNPKKSNTLTHDFILSVLEDRKSDLWIGTVKGLNRMDRKSGSITRYVFHPEDTTTFGSNFVASVLQSRQGEIWVACWMVPGDVHKLNSANGKYETYRIGGMVSCLFEDDHGVLWAGGEEGLFQFNRRKNSFEPFVDSNAYTKFINVRSIIEDDKKNLWIVAKNGILRLDPKRGVTRIYGRNDGINGNTLSFRPAYKASNGKLYFGSYSGYFVLSPGQLIKSSTPPQIVISNFQLSNIKLPEEDRNLVLTAPLHQLKDLQLRYNQNAFTFSFTAIDYAYPEDNRHFFMLENYNDNWIQAGSDRKAIYFNVPPGKYVFRVKAANSEGIWAEKSINIVITPPWWGTWWFRIAAVIVILAMLYGAMRWRMHQKFRLQLERFEKERQLAQLQRKTSELEMQALRAQMNPHFIFNSLNSINRFILQNDKFQASEYLTKFSRLVRAILQNSQASLISLESELESLKLYLELEALRFNHQFEYKIVVDNELDISSLKVPPLIIQPYAENAIWHGLMQKGDKGHLDIELFQRDTSLFCKITDDGVGRKKAADLKSKSAATHKSMGMRITADRIAMLQQKNDVDTLITITDLVLPDGSPGGTEVLIKIPMIYD